MKIDGTSSTRGIVERVFGVLKRHHGISKSRYLGLTENKDVALMLVFINDWRDHSRGST
ncbi:MAG: hypothetical protein O7D86_00050 [Proteobacteria bacterium]|nr:hypothetical protein [Pseudomonadota bacterium]